MLISKIKRCNINDGSVTTSTSTTVATAPFTSTSVSTVSSTASTASTILSTITVSTTSVTTTTPAPTTTSGILYCYECNSNWAACADPPNLSSIAGNKIPCTGSCYTYYSYGGKKIV